MEFDSNIEGMALGKKILEKLDEKDRCLLLLKRSSKMINSMMKGLNEVPVETRERIMEECGEACAIATGDVSIAKQIASETTDIDEILKRINEEEIWCGPWTRQGGVIQSVCVECGCPLVANNVVELTETLCYCSRGWVKTVFETLLKKPVRVELEKSIGGGDKVCKYVLYLE